MKIVQLWNNLVVEQLSCETGQLWNCMAVERLGWVCLGKEAQVRRLWCYSFKLGHNSSATSQFQWDNAPSVIGPVGEMQCSVENEGVLHRERGQVGLHREKFLTILQQFVSMQMRIQPLQFGVNTAILIGQNRGTLIGQWKCKGRCSCRAPVGQK